MGPNVIFVLPIIDAFPDKKIGVIFVWQKRTNRGWGGVVFKTHFFPSQFFERLPNKHKYQHIYKYKIRTPVTGGAYRVELAEY